MIDIVQFRCRIGIYNLNLTKWAKHGLRPRKSNYRLSSLIIINNFDRKKVCYGLLLVLSTVTILSMVESIMSRKMFQSSSCDIDYSLITSRSQTLTSLSKVKQSTPAHSITFIFKMTGNFYARYINGNGKEIRGVKVLHLNIRSLQNKIGEVKQIVKDHKPHLLGISECELFKESRGLNLDILKVPGYNLHLPQSWNDHGYARVVLYSKKPFTCQRISELEDSHLQSIWVKFGFKNCKPGLYCHGYREHNSNLGGSMNAQTDKLTTFMTQWEKAVYHGNPSEPNDVFILADMNLDSLHGKWLNPGYSLFNLAKIVQSTCDSHGFTQLISEVTRCQFNSIANSTELSCLDHIYTNCKYKCSQPFVINFGDSDHDIIGIVRLSKVPSPPCRFIRKRCYKDFKKEHFLIDIQNENWLEVYFYQDVNDAVSCFTMEFRNILNKHAPWKKIQQRKFFVPWISKETKELMRQRDQWKLKAKGLACNPNHGLSSQEEVEAWRQYKLYRNKINNIKKNDEYKFKKELVSPHLDSSSDMWSNVKSFMNWKSAGTPRQILDQNKMYSKSLDIARLLNTFFVQKIKLLSSQFKSYPPNYDGCHKAMGPKGCKMYLQFATVKQVTKIIKNLKSSKSLAIDELDSFSLKIAAEVIGPVVHHLVTLSLMQNRFPEAWKLSKVIPLHKKGSALDKNNYRPVSILSPISKVLERVVYNQIYDYFSKNKLFHKNSMGFRKNRSTLTALLQMYDRWVRAANDGKVSSVVLLDLSAAFDLVSPEILLEKLKIYGIDKDCLEWMMSYLTDRKQGVWIDHVLSEWLDIDVGVPQGSILGPLLFVIFANDLPFLISSEVDTYADDSTITASSDNMLDLNDEINSSCASVHKWMKENRLCLNVEKTHLMLVGTQRRLQNLNKEDLDITINNVHLSESLNGSEKLLGVQIMPSLKWAEHIAHLKGKLKLRVVGIQKLRFVLPTCKLKLVAEGIFNSLLTYCIPLWGCCEASDIRSLQVLQNVVARHVLKRPVRSQRSELYDSLGWMTVHQLAVYHSLLIVMKIRKTMEPEYLFDQLSHENFRGKIIVPNTHLSLAKKSFCWRAAECWNKLPEDMKNSECFRKFKKELKDWVCNNVMRFPE